MLYNKTKFISAISAVVLSTAMIVSCSSTYHNESTGQFVDGSVITTKVKAKLLADKMVNAFPITVKTYKGTVQLSGFVNNYDQKMRAEDIARSVPGVLQVQDSLIVKSN